MRRAKPADTGTLPLFPEAMAEVERDEPANPNWTGVPLAVRVYQDWTCRPNRETDGYPRNTPSRSPLLRWNPHTARYGHRP